MIREGTSIVVVGASWGGLAALNCLIGGLPADFEAPVAVVQHRSRHADNLLVPLLQDVATAQKLLEAPELITATAVRCEGGDYIKQLNWGDC